MNLIMIAKRITAAAVLLAIAQAAAAGGLDKAKQVVRDITPAQVDGSTGTKRNPAGDSAGDYRPQQRMGEMKEPPSPVNRNNPRNDPDVQRGFDQHQRQHGR